MTTRLVDTTQIDDGSVTPRSDLPRRRTLTADYEAQILAEYEAAETGERGAILRRESLYASHITEWRKAAAAGVTTALGPKPRAGVQRQPLQRGSVQDAEVHARLPRVVRILGRRPGLLRVVFPLVTICR